MPTYRWSCLACGESNAAEAVTCQACGCSSRPTARDIDRARASFVAQGGALKGDAAVATQPDLSAWEVLGRPLLRLVGWAAGAAFASIWR